MHARSALLLAALTLPAAAQSPKPAARPAPTASANLSSMTMDGTVGSFPIRFNYTVRNNTELVAAHYFYTSKLIDIPLHGAVHGQTVDLTGNDGSTFHLTFIGNGSQGAQPLTFYNSVGLRGTWTDAGKTLPVTLAAGASTANPGDRIYADVTDQSDAAFEAMVRTIRDAILANNLDVLAAHVHYPLRINTHPVTTIHNAAELKARWPHFATPAFLEQIRHTVPHEMFVHNGQAMLGNGQLWFDNKGLTSVNPDTQ